MKKLLFIICIAFLFIGCTQIPIDQFEYKDIPNQNKGKK